MTNLFLKVNKDLFKLGLNPTEILLLAQVMEFQTNTGDCFISDEVLAEQFGVSTKTISRTLKALEDRGFVKRDTKNIRNGRERHISANLANIEKELAKDNLSFAENPTDKLSFAQQTNCPLHNGQNDFIKDNTIDKKEKDNNSGDNSAIGFASAEVITLEEPEEEVVGEITEEALKRMGASYEKLSGNKVKISGTGKLFKLK